MSEKIVQLNEEIIKGQLKELVRGSVEETLNELLEKEAESLTQAARYERSEARQGYRSGHYDRNLTTTSGDVTLHMPRLKGVSFETAIIERYRRRAMLKDAPIVVLDEATAYIDPENEALVQRAVGKLVAGRTVLVIAHRLSTITGADQIVVVNGGRIEATGKHEKLLETCPLYREMWQAHMGVKEGEQA